MSGRPDQKPNGVLIAHAEHEQVQRVRRFHGSSLALLFAELHQRRVTGRVILELDLSQGSLATFTATEREK